jgi:hypothetical protein
MTDKNDDVIALQEAYANVYNEIVKPDRVFVATQYFRQKWVPLLGHSLAWVIIALRQHCYWSKETKEKRDWCVIGQEELAAETGTSVATLKRLLQHEHASKFITDISHRYRYDTQLGKKVRRKSMYRIRMDDPLTPDDEDRLKERLAQKLAGLNIDPETGQIDVLQLLEQLSEARLDDLQLNLSHRSKTQLATEEPTEITPATQQLAEQLSKLLAGSANGSSTTSASEDLIPFPNAQYIPADELRHFELGQDQVLIPWQQDYLAVPIVEVIKRDLRVSGGHLTDLTRTECYFSVLHALDEAPQDWLPEEQERVQRMSQLAQEIGDLYEQLGAFTLEEALQQYFSSDLAAKFIANTSDTELQRIRAWLVYTRKAKGLKTPSGFLRSRLESGEYPPTHSDQ